MFTYFVKVQDGKHSLRTASLRHQLHQLNRDGSFDFPAEFTGACDRNCAPSTRLEKTLPSRMCGTTRAASTNKFCRIHSFSSGTGNRLQEAASAYSGKAIGVTGTDDRRTSRTDWSPFYASDFQRSRTGSRSFIARSVSSKKSGERIAVQDVLKSFRKLGDTPSILVNVDMLTEGFDDPKVSTVVLARLTLSTNRFWQMIGRGRRGIAAGGTKDCQVIDPVKLVRLYDYFSGYQPSLTRQTDVELEDTEQDDGGEGQLAARTPPIHLPPDPRTCTYQVDPELERIHAHVAARPFATSLGAVSLSESQALQLARVAEVVFDRGGPTLVRSDKAFSSTTAAAVILGELTALEQRTGKDLLWFRRLLPDPLDEALLKQRLRMLRAIEELGLSTESDCAVAQISGAFLRALEREAAAAASVTPLVSLITLAPHEEAMIDVALALATVDGEVHTNEIAIIVEFLRDRLARATTDELTRAVENRTGPRLVPVERIRSQVPPLLWQPLVQLRQRGWLGRGWHNHRLGATLRARDFAWPSCGDAFVDDLLGRAHCTQATSPSRVCSSCRFDMPDGAFCPHCGVQQHRDESTRARHG